MDYKFEALSPRSFEHLTQALALKHVGVGGIVFGDGPDGGREATFAGQTTYDTGDGPWNGYIVMQAKFRQRPEGTTSDGQWLLAELRKEIAEFLKDQAPRKAPEYYILVTNVVLGPAQDAGAKDKVTKALQTDGFALKGFDVWDYDKLRAFIDGASDIRRAYSAWLTPGDVLHAALEHIQDTRPEFEPTLAKYLQMELLSDQYANLEQAGHSPDDRVPMASVFVDLPVRTSERDPQQTSRPFVADLLIAAAEKLSPSAIDSEAVGRSTAGGRVVLVGGPGQGKTTLGQFVCQLFRASILRGRARLTADAASVVTLIDQWCERDGYVLPGVRRFPLRISLSHFAKELAEEGSDVASVISYLHARIARRTGTEIGLTAFRQWLGEYPWLLVLDGLDEVPPSSNRGDVLAAVRDFMVEVAESDVDVLVLATTRPQGYGDDFNPRYYRHKYLVPLSTARALDYGRRLSDIRFGEDPDRYDRVVARLAAAVSNEATARLMTSPLQVTIMTILVDRRGQPPQERWSLFSEYYAAIFARELERDVSTSGILRAHKANVDAIHRRVGLVLQSETEEASGSDARMSAARFKELVCQRLTDEGYEADQLYEVEAQIVEAAAHRLVFLVGLEAGIVGFEIRSLQEFMAAEGLMQGTADVVQRRLEAIAASPNWRNVFLFAAGYCFAEQQYLRDTVYRIAVSLNESDDSALALTLAGSRLAADILDEGTVRQQPKYAKLFATLALQLLDLPASDLQLQLARSYDSSFERAYTVEVIRRLDASEFEDAIGAWQCLAGLAWRGVDWATDVCLERWPSVAEDGAKLLELFGSESVRSDLEDRMIVERLRQPFYFSRGRARPEGTLEPRRWLRALREVCRAIHLKRTGPRLSIGGLTLTTAVSSIAELFEGPADQLMSIPCAAHSSWDAVRSLGKFAHDRDLTSAAETMRSMSRLVMDEIPGPLRSPTGSGRAEWMVSEWPWPFVALVLSARDAADVERRTLALERGEYGDVRDWLERERSWDGVMWDLSASAKLYDPDDPLKDNERSNAFPLAAIAQFVGMRSWVSTKDALGTLVDMVGDLKGPGRHLAADLVLKVVEVSRAAAPMARPTLEAWCALQELAGRPPVAHSVAFVASVAAEDDAALRELIGPVGIQFEKYELRPPMMSLRVDGIVDLANVARAALVGGATEGRDGLIKLLAVTSASDDRDVTAIKEIQELSIDDALRGAVLLLKCLPSGTEREVAQLVEWIVVKPHRLELVRDGASRRGLPNEWYIDLLRRVVRFSSTCARSGYVASELHEAIGRRLTPLARAGNWQQYDLVAPPPSQNTVAPGAAWTPSAERR